MSKISFPVNIPPEEALRLVKQQLNADLVHEEVHSISEDILIGTSIFEKYYFRNKSRAALVVIADNLKGHTNVRVIATGSSDGFIFNFDWGAGDDFVSSVEEILDKYRT